MPELPEVETTRRTVERALKGKRIVNVIPDDDLIVYDGASPEEFRDAIEGAKVTGSGRKGKYFWLELNRKPWPIFHLGMSGNIAILNPQAKLNSHQKVWGGAKLWDENSKDLRERLWFCRLLLKMEKGTELALIDPRRFGRMWLADDPLEHSRIKRLGYDPLIQFPTSKVLSERLKKRKKSIKSVLLDQSLF